MVTDFSSALTRAHTVKEHLRFLQQCKDEQVFPRTMLPAHVVQLQDRPYDDFQHNILEKHINNKKEEKNKAFEELRRAKLHFRSTVPIQQQASLEDYCYEQMRASVYEELRVNHDRKMKLLIDRSGWTTNANEDCIVNLSNKQLERDTVCALGYGLNFGISESSINHVEIVKGLCNLEKIR